jgi:apolipoprotein D and lipocalin family protein
MTQYLLLFTSLILVNDLATVPRVDLARYSGSWYEIARTPNKYQSDCAWDVRLTYTLRPDGKLGVRSECTKRDGSLDIANGSAKASDESNAKLRITFFWPFSADYWIIDIDEEYSYAVVGEPSRRDLWILSRTPSIPDAIYQRIVGRVAAKGYDTSRIVVTPRKGR